MRCLRIGRCLPSVKDFQTKDEREAAEKRLKEITAARIREEERYRAFELQKITGVSAAERQRRQDEIRFLRERNLLEAYHWSQTVLGNKLDVASLLGPGVNLSATSPAPGYSLPMNPIAWASMVNNGAISSQSMIDSTKIPGKTLGSLFSSGFGGAMGNLPSTILRAITNDGNVGSSVGSLFGSSIGTSVGSKFGGFLGNLIPGVGALLGPALGKLFGAIGGIGANSTKQGRGDFAKQLGFESLDNLYNKLRSMGAEGDKLVNTALNVIGKKDEAANRKWMQDVTAFFDRLEKVPGKVNELSQALGKFGGAIPKQLDPLLDSILGSANLSPELRKQLTGMRTPAWQSAQEFASRLGVNTGALGGGFNQSRLGESAFELKRALDLFARFEGSDQDAILRDMADEFSALAADAQKSNVALPRAVQEFIRQIDEMGLLLDENGNRIEFSLLKFADIQDEYEKEVVSLLEQIRDLLSGTGSAASGAGASVGVPSSGLGRIWRGYDGGEEIAMPSFRGGTHGAYQDFGAGTPVMLHGKERVMTEAEGRGGGMMTVILEQDGRAAARFVAPYLPGEVKRLRLAP